MKKGFYLVVAFLMGGATLTMNSCIDTKEPAGIEAMRNAKAEYLKALAEFRSAKAMLEMIEVERAKLELEIERINHEANKYNAMASVQEAMYAYYVRIAEAEKEYLESIISIRIAMVNLKDEAVAEAMLECEERLETAMNKLSDARKELIVNKIKKMNFEQDKAIFAESLPLAKAEKQKEIELLTAYIEKLESIQELDVNDTEALEKELVAYKQELKALDEKEYQIMMEIQSLKQFSTEDALAIANLKKEIADEEKKKENEKVLTISKDLVGTDISADFNTILTNFDNTAVSSGYETNFANIHDASGNMVASYQVKGIELQDFVALAQYLAFDCENEKANAETSGASFIASLWDNLCKSINSQITAAQNEMKSITDNITNKEKEVKAIQDKYNGAAYWQKELDCYMVKGSTTVQINGASVNVFSTNNPYEYVATLGGVVTESSKIDEAIALVEYAINNKSFPTFICYNETTGAVETITGTAGLRRNIEDARTKINNAKSALAKISNVIAAITENGVISTAWDWEDFFKNNTDAITYVEELNDAITCGERKVAAYENVVAVYKASIDKVVAAYESGELLTDIPGVENDEAATDAPETDVPADEEGAEEEAEGEDAPAEE
ncbi:MAG: hypothetical protein J6U58_04715 [Bacteroidaceae bacterium]|nr:hypothetical protein [Bacteroidaceae bacterium]